MVSHKAGFREGVVQHDLSGILLLRNAGESHSAGQMLRSAAGCCGSFRFPNSFELSRLPKSQLPPNIEGSCFKKVSMWVADIFNFWKRPGQPETV